MDLESEINDDDSYYCLTDVRPANFNGHPNMWQKFGWVLLGDLRGWCSS